jgi:hypothetical protein
MIGTLLRLTFDVGWVATVASDDVALAAIVVGIDVLTVVWR